MTFISLISKLIEGIKYKDWWYCSSLNFGSGLLVSKNPRPWIIKNACPFSIMSQDYTHLASKIKKTQYYLSGTHVKINSIVLPLLKRVEFLYFYIYQFLLPIPIDKKLTALYSKWISVLEDVYILIPKTVSVLYYTANGN